MKRLIPTLALALAGLANATTYTVIVDDQSERTRTVWEGCVGYAAYGVFGKQGYVEGACESKHAEDFEEATQAPPQFYYVMLYSGSSERYLREDCVLQRFTMSVGDAPESGQVFVACGFPAERIQPR